MGTTHDREIYFHAQDKGTIITIEISRYAGVVSPLNITQLEQQTCYVATIQEPSTFQTSSAASPTRTPSKTVTAHSLKRQQL
jgi:hypothetical protein